MNFASFLESNGGMEAANFGTTAMVAGINTATGQMGQQMAGDSLEWMGMSTNQELLTAINENPQAAQLAMQEVNGKGYNSQTVSNDMGVTPGFNGPGRGPGGGMGIA